jgi:Lon protease-like protein
MPEIALFPLRTVLFPGGLLPLRVFEARYLDMVRRGLRQQAAFGVVRLLAGRDTDREVDTAPVGTSASIVDFETLEDGLLGLLCRGERRFRILKRSRREDGLNCAQIEWVPEPDAAALAPEFEPLLAPLRRALSRLETLGRFMEPHFEDAGWVSHRLAELLPLESGLQQRLLEMDDAGSRLRLLAPLIETGS